MLPYPSIVPCTVALQVGGQYRLRLINPAVFSFNWVGASTSHCPHSQLQYLGMQSITPPLHLNIIGNANINSLQAPQMKPLLALIAEALNVNIGNVRASAKACRLWSLHRPASIGVLNLKSQLDLLYILQGLRCTQSFSSKSVTSYCYWRWVTLTGRNNTRQAQLVYHSLA